MLGRVKVVLSFVALLMVFTLVLSTNLSKADNNPDLLNQEAILNVEQFSSMLNASDEMSELLENVQSELREPPPLPEMLGSRDANIRVNVMPGAGVGNGRAYTWPGRSLKVWGNVTNGTSPYTYEWVFGDGTPNASGTVADVRNIEVLHTYTTLGQKKAILTVTDADGDIDVDTVVINVEPFDIQIEINATIHDGLHWLYLQQYADGHWYGWTYYSNSNVAATAQAVVCFENDGFLPIDDPDKNIYVDCIKNGLDYVTSQLVAINIGTQAFCNPEEIADGNTDNNGLGVYANDVRTTYSIGPVIMALVGSGDATLVANNGPANIVGRTYYDLVVDMVDFCAWSQVDINNYYRGGWRYSPNYSSSDNSVAQWPAIGMEAAETQWGIYPPPCVKSELTRWINNSRYSSGCFKYTTGGGSLAMTGAGICEMAFCDIPVTDSRFQTALDCLNSRWNSSDNKGFYYGMYAISKGLRIAVNDIGELDPVEEINGMDWYLDYARYLIDRQNPDGSWPGASYWSNLGIFDDQWAILVLEPGWTSCLTFADINAPDTVAPSTGFMVDGLSSDNSCEDLVINEWLWDFDLADGVDWDNPDAVGAEVMNPGYELLGNIEEGSFTITLKVRDNADKPNYAQASKTIIVNRDNHPPVADCGGPYSGKVGEIITFNGAGSWDPDEVLLQDYIDSYAWDLDGDGEFDDCFDPTCTNVWNTPYIGKIGLMVTDKFGRVASSACIVDIIIDTVDIFIGNQDISFTQLTNDTVLITAVVHCSTYVATPFSVEPFVVRFYDGNPEASSIVIGDDQIINDMITGETRTVSVKWVFDDEECHDIFVRVDPWSSGFPFGEIPEYNEWFNNEATKTKCPCGDEIIILPNPMAIPMANYIGPIVDTVELNGESWIVDLPAFQAYMFIGGFTEEYPANSLDFSSIRINDTIVPIEVSVVNDVPVFPEMEEVLFIKFKIREFILHYGWIYDFYDYKFTVTGNFNDQTPFEECGMVPIRGHISGDINNDGMSDIVDLTLMIDYIFRNVEIDNIESTGDINHDGQITITDLTEFISYLFVNN